MMSVALDFGDNKDLDYSKLLTQNKALQSELKQCQADKDFVWSLWKRLQVSNPDVTEAISLVIQREKEKAEAKDHKVLEILQVKDDRIEELQNIVAKQSQEISELLSKKVDLQEKNGRLQAEADNLHDKATTLELKGLHGVSSVSSASNAHIVLGFCSGPASSGFAASCFGGARDDEAALLSQCSQRLPDRSSDLLGAAGVLPQTESPAATPTNRVINGQTSWTQFALSRRAATPAWPGPREGTVNLGGVKGYIPPSQPAGSDLTFAPVWRVPAKGSNCLA
ncbi:hypothetical protein BaRGS_00030917 [Batillaria attramentaria]|uniref:Centlein n=1 Tax=Batillaria attramentaria TaxID=370345 RepID=A0ABD0JT39_9CAEN